MSMQETGDNTTKTSTVQSTQGVEEEYRGEQRGQASALMKTELKVSTMTKYKHHKRRDRNTTWAET